jgi:hypothetical protein
VENSLQETAGSFTFCGMKKIALLLLALFPAVLLTPVSAQATLSCNAGLCSKTFNYTGSTQEFEVPDGVVSIKFEVYGASGSRSNGGGYVEGWLSQLPERLFIEVGGSGLSGPDREGGYNGGGRSGSTGTNPGSGGGASDIRLGTDLESRVAVAGGGGGGGSAGGFGGSGGLTGAAGAAGTQPGGGGGTQTQGGTAAVNAAEGQEPTAGQFGQGGNGGFGTAAGGGGGGGWYGGGGGASGTTGSGGGGGSSYVDPTRVTGVYYSSGSNFGHGRVVIYYYEPINLLSFSAAQTLQNEVRFYLEFDQNITGLSDSDFILSGTGCTIWRTNLNQKLVNLQIRNCQHGEVSLTLKARSVGTNSLGPMESATVVGFSDRQGPVFAWLSQPVLTSASELVVQYSLSDDKVLLTSHLTLPPCEVAIEPGLILLSGCSEGLHQISVLPGTMTDSWGNVGPAASSYFFEIDQTAPTAQFEDIQVIDGELFRYQTRITSSEQVLFDPESVQFTGPEECSNGFDEEWFWAICDYAEVSWSLNNLALTDLAGNQAQEPLFISLVHSEPIPEPELEPEPELTPEEGATPEVTDVPEPVQPAPEPEPTPAPEPEPVFEPVPVFTPEPVTDSPILEPEPDPATESEEVAEPVQELDPNPVTEWYPLPEILEPIQVLLPALIAPAFQAAIEEIVVAEEVVDPMPEPLATAEVATVDRTSRLVQSAVFEEELAAEQPTGIPWLQLSALVAALLVGVGMWRFSGR